MEYRELETRVGAYMTSCLRDASIHTQEDLLRAVRDFGKSLGGTEADVERAITEAAQRIKQAQA
jgi:hypothetical protein